MKIKKNILTLSLILATVVGFAQSPGWIPSYQLNYPKIKFGNSALGEHQMNGFFYFINKINLNDVYISGNTEFKSDQTIRWNNPALYGKLLGIDGSGYFGAIDIPSSPVTSVNGRTGAVTGLAEASSLANYMDLTTNQTAAGNKTFTNNVATGGTLMVGSASGNNMFFDNSGSGYMSFSARNNGASQGMNWNAAEFFFNGKMSFPSGVLEYPSFGSGNFVFNNARTAGSMLFQNNGVNRMEITSSTTNVTGDMGVKGNFSTFPLTGTYPYLTMSTAGIFSAIGSATNRININASNQVISFQQGAILGGVSSSILTANRSWVFPDKAGTVAMTSDFATENLQTVTSRGNATTTGASFMGDVGIGLNTTPLQTLHVRTNNSLSNARGLLIENSSTGATGFQIGNSIIPPNKKWQVFVKDENSTGNPDNYTFTIGQDNVADYITIKSVSGNTGIGNQNPSSKLDVSGSVRASENDGNASTLVRNTDLANYALKTPVFQTSGTSATLISSGRYIPQNASLTIYTLPTTAAVGDVIFINGKGAGGWRIAQNTGQVIHGATDTTTGSAGYVGSTARYNSIAIVCVTANTEWIIQSSQGSLTIN